MTLHDAFAIFGAAVYLLLCGAFGVWLGIETCRFLDRLLDSCHERKRVDR